jgi:tetratricopeptide (TPR) repeat protein
MGLTYQHRWLPALAVLAAIALPVRTALCETRAQAAPQPPALASSQNAAPVPDADPARTQAATQAPALAQTPEVAKPPQPAEPVAVTAATPEDLGDALMAQQRYQAALEAYQKNLNRSAELWNKMGIAYQLMFNQEAAMHCYQSSLRIDPKNARVMNNLGTIYDAEKEYSNAERMYRKALKADPKSALIYKNLGTNLLSQHKYKKGWEVYQIALELDPNIFRNSASPRIQNPASVEERGAMNYYMAKGCVRAGMNDCAIEYLRMALNEGFTNPKKIAADSEFASLKGLPEFQQLLASQRQQ